MISPHSMKNSLLGAGWRSFTLTVLLRAIAVTQVWRVDGELLDDFHVVLEHEAAVLPGISHLFGELTPEREDLVRVRRVAVE